MSHYQIPCGTIIPLTRRFRFRKQVMQDHHERQHCEVSSDLCVGDRVRIMAGTFEGFEALVDSVEPGSGNATALLMVGFSLIPIALQDEKWQRIIQEPAK